ncbi:MAG: hypothetical protein RR354_03890 [Mucinivorans sp.]
MNTENFNPEQNPQEPQVTAPKVSYPNKASLGRITERATTYPLRVWMAAASVAMVIGAGAAFFTGDQNTEGENVGCKNIEPAAITLNSMTIATTSPTTITPEQEPIKPITNSVTEPPSKKIARSAKPIIEDKIAPQITLNTPTIRITLLEQSIPTVSCPQTRIAANDQEALPPKKEKRTNKFFQEIANNFRENIQGFQYERDTTQRFGQMFIESFQAASTRFAEFKNKLTSSNRYENN